MDASSIEQRGLDELRQLLHSQPRYIKAHAAESLLMFGHPDGVHDLFMKEWESHQNDPGYRVVIMRILSRASKTAAERAEWTKRIRDVFVDPAQPDRLHAIECLAKLAYLVPSADQKLFDQVTAAKEPDIAIMARWTLAATDFKSQEHPLVEYLTSPDSTARYSAAYALRQLPDISGDTKKAIRAAARAEKPGTLAFSYLNSASLVVSTPGDREEAARSRGELTKLAKTVDKDEAREIAAAFAVCGTTEDVPTLNDLLASPDPDIREAAAHALVAIARRTQDRSPM
jgi:hypothetical protein